MKESKTMRLDKSLVKAVKKKAEKENRSFTNMVEVLLTKAVKA